MLDFFNIPADAQADVQVFCMSDGISPDVDWTYVTWQKPRGVSMVSMLLVGAGGAGCGGITSTTGTGAGGGGGGTCTFLIIPSILLPDILYVYVGAGGKAVAGSSDATFPTTHTNGGPTLVTTWPVGSSTLYEWNVAIAFGGSKAFGNAGGSAGAAAIAPYMNFGTLGYWASIAGMTGNTGGASGANGTGASLLSAGKPFSGGAGGGGQGATLGGGQVSTGTFPSTLYGRYDLGSAGMQMNLGPATGGCGGGGRTAGAAYAGGHGSIGCGGGGGGSANATGPGGNGGNGGPGICIITSW